MAVLIKWRLQEQDRLPAVQMEGEGQGGVSPFKAHCSTTNMLLGQFPFRAHTNLMGSIPGRGACDRQQSCVSLSY